MPDKLTLLPMPREMHFTGTSVANTRELAIETRVDPSLPPQGYRLEIMPAKVLIAAADDAGAFHARQTLKQILRHETVPGLRIEDTPDFAVRGVMLDISRDKVPTMATLYG